MGITRRDFIKAAAAGTVLTGIGLPSIAFGAQKKVKIGFLAPLTGEVAGWGLPGLYGCEIWGEWVNAAGGVKIGGSLNGKDAADLIVSFGAGNAPDCRYIGITGQCQQLFGAWFCRQDSQVVFLGPFMSRF